MAFIRRLSDKKADSSTACCYDYLVDEKIKVALTCCSDRRKDGEKEEIGKLERVLESMGMEFVESSFLYSDAAPAIKAGELMEFFMDREIGEIFDISGGNLSNTLLPFLDYGRIGGNTKRLWGYSDLTALMNGIHARTGNISMLYQVRNIVKDASGRQLKEFGDFLIGGKKDLVSFDFRFLRKNSMEGVLVGGNARCLLKLAGTPCFPDMEGKILLLEALHGNPELIESLFSQLEQIGVFEKVAGILLGTFTELEGKKHPGGPAGLLMRHVPKDIPVAVTGCIGHASNSKAAVIGEHIKLSQQRFPAGSPFHT